MKQNRYPEGYQPKIDYYNYKLVRAIENMDAEAVQFYAGKLAYFVGRQKQLVIKNLEQLYK